MKEDASVLRLLYTFFVGVLLAVFVGVGVATFYTAPKSPEYPIELNTLGKEPTAEQLALERKYSMKMEEYNEVMKPYNRKTSLITLCAAVILLGISLIYEKRMKILAEGVMLGGLFTLIYSLGRSFAADDTKYSFLAVTVSLVIVLFLGYHRFVSGHNSVAKAPKILP